MPFHHLTMSIDYFIKENFFLQFSSSEIEMMHTEDFIETFHISIETLSGSTMCVRCVDMLTASMPDSCMPMLMTTTLRTCQRTESSINSLHTDRVSSDDSERCSSCISSISAWMLHLARYHFSAGGRDRK